MRKSGWLPWPYVVSWPTYDRFPLGPISTSGPITYVWVRMDDSPLEVVYVWQVLRLALLSNLSKHVGLGGGEGDPDDVYGKSCRLTVEMKVATGEKVYVIFLLETGQGSSFEGLWKEIRRRKEEARLSVNTALKTWHLTHSFGSSTMCKDPYWNTSYSELANTIEHLLWNMLLIIAIITIIIVITIIKINTCWVLSSVRY